MLPSFADRHAAFRSRMASVQTQDAEIGTVPLSTCTNKSVAASTFIPSIRTVWDMPSLIKSIPTEIVCEIFDQCLFHEGGYRRGERSFDPLSNKGVPWVLSYVCRTWRDIALSNPCLWNCPRLEFFGISSFRRGKDSSGKEVSCL
jgi:hypothetical protein